MNYLSVENLSHNWGDVCLFDHISFGLSEGQKAALIARNGAGKTTLLNLLTGKLLPDNGSITYNDDIKVGYLPQDPYLEKQHTVLEEVFNTGSEVVETIKAYEDALVHNDQKALGGLIEQMDRLNAWDYEQRAKQILSQLKITNFEQKVNELSGGQQKRVALAGILISEPDLLILDEPTNHLDLDMIDWLEQYLSKSRATLLMVTHDRYFLDRVCNEIYELDQQTLFRYQGNYSYFLDKRDERIANTQAEVERARNLLRKEQDWMNRQPQARATKAKSRIDAFYNLKDKASTRVDNRQLELNIESSRLGSKVLDMYDVSKGFDALKLINRFSYKFMPREKVGVVGNNGTGKSTFLNLITGALSPDSGTIEIGETVVFGYYRQEGIRLDEEKKVIEVISEISESISTGSAQGMGAAQFLRYFLFPNEMHYVPVSKLSGGEKKRLYLMTVLMRNPNFLILDEPTNDLDIFTLAVLEEYLQNFQGTVMIVSHDRYFMDKVAEHLFVFEGDGAIRDFPGNYSEYQMEVKSKEKEPTVAKKENVKPAKVDSDKPKKMSFKEKRELETLEADIARLEAQKGDIETQLSSGILPAQELVGLSALHGTVVAQLEEKEMRWLELND
ncbi:MAG: ABC-F family ATP-binding cassette domain-containing protein [Breznakibacter sp.]